MIPWQLGKKMLGKDLVRLRALRNPASHMFERVSQMFKTFIQNQWHVAQFLLRVGSIWCKHELLAAWSGALSKTKLTAHWLLFPFWLFRAIFLSAFAALEVWLSFRGGNSRTTLLLFMSCSAGEQLAVIPMKRGDGVCCTCVWIQSLSLGKKKRSGADEPVNIVITALHYNKICFTKRITESHSQEIISDVLFRADRIQGLPSLGSLWTGNFRPKSNTEWFWGAKQCHEFTMKYYLMHACRNSKPQVQVTALKWLQKGLTRSDKSNQLTELTFWL